MRVVISGRVQGVGFRYFTRSLAQELGLAGEVWNRRDGLVEAVVEGPPSAVDSFVSRLRSGPGHVADVKTYEEPESGRSEFEIGPTR